MKRTILGVEISASIKECLVQIASIESDKKRLKITPSDVVRWFLEDGIENYQLGGKHEK